MPRISKTVITAGGGFIDEKKYAIYNFSYSSAYLLPTYKQIYCSY